MTVTSKRPEHVALVSLILSVIFFGITFFLGQWSNIDAIFAVSWLFLSVALIWFVLTLQFHQRGLAEQEKLDIGLLDKDEKSSTIFQARNERKAMFSAAQRRLEIFEKWFLPILSALIAVFQITIGLILLRKSQDLIEAQIKQTLLCAVFLMAIAFISFLLSRYATGMSAELKWKPLRAGGSSLLGAALLCFIIAIALALVHLFRLNYLLDIISIVILVLLVVLGLETVFNIVFDIYRPRLKDQYGRSAFDSRLLGVINEPGGILRSAADAIDYQFGFKVSQTWFYKLLEEAIIPLVLFGVVTLYLLSCVVIVEPDEQVIIEYFGNPVNDANDIRIAGPGLTLKLPWPIEKAYKYPVAKIKEIGIGYIADDDPEAKANPMPKLWGMLHYDEEYQLLVSSEQTNAESDAETVPVSIVIAAVPVQYRVNDLYSYIYKHNEPEKLLESICYHELTKYAATAKIETEDSDDNGASLLGTGRAEAARILTENIQKAADDNELGIEIVFLGLQGVHPPVDVAADYQQVIGAYQQKQRIILEAKAESNKILSELIGSVDKAQELRDLAQRHEELQQRYEQQQDDELLEQINNLEQQLDTAFGQAKGSIFKTLSESVAYAFEKQSQAKADGERFTGQLKAFKAAPEIYKREQWLSMYEQALQDIPKYIIVVDQNDTQVTIIDLQDVTGSIYQGISD
ncbi:SPFH domain-containing protein [Planctomycetota bacterium]